MKKVLLSLLLFLPLFVVAQSVEFNKSWYEYNAEYNGKKGVYFHYNFTIHNCQNQELKIQMYICDSNNKPIRSNDNAYSSPEGIISALSRITPKYKDSSFNDFKLFISYDAMPSGNPAFTYHYYLEIKTSNGTTIQKSSQYDFYWGSYNSNNKSSNSLSCSSSSTVSIGGKTYHIEGPNSSIIVKDGKVFINGIDVTSNYDYDKKNDPEPYNYNKPTIEWLSAYTSNTASFVAKAGIKSNTTLTQTSLSVNGTVYRGMKTVVNDGYQRVINENVTLQNGTNKITITATNAGGTTTETFNVTYNMTNPNPSSIEKRVALVIGNANYSAQSLNNPVNDAYDVSTSLKRLGFDVITLTNGTKRQMEDAISQLRAKADKNSIAMFYYAGHGIQKDGRNYLIPVDAVLRDASDVDYACTDVGRVLSNMEASGCSRNIIVLDACRDNPFERSWSRSLGTRGLSSLNAPKGTIIAYATSPGEVAQDGRGRNSPYAEAFLHALNTPGIEVIDLFRQINDEVSSKTNDTQTPWMLTNFKGKFYF